MKIGIDIDGVIIDTITHISCELSKHFGYEVTCDDIAHNFSKISGAGDICDQNGEYYYHSLEPIQDAVDVINELHKKHEIFFISARFKVHYEGTLKWFKKHGIKAEKIIFLEGKSKVDTCRSLGIDLFIEDSAINASELSEVGIPVILLKTEYNKHLECDNVAHCNSWAEIRGRLIEK